MPLYWNYLKSIANQVSLYGSNDDDLLIATPTKPYVYGLDGHDALWGNSATTSYLFGGGGHDNFYATSAVEHIYGGTGWDTVRYDGSSTGITVNLENGQGFLGDAAGDQLHSIEVVSGSAFNDAIFGSNNNDWDGADRLFGNAGNDTLYGRDGGDNLNGGSNGGGVFGDILFGGAGRDHFVFSGPDASREVPDVGVDVVMDFNEAEGDLIRIESTGYLFTPLDFLGEATGFSGTGSEVWYEKVVSQVHGEVTYLHARLLDGHQGDSGEFTFFDIVLDGYMDLTKDSVIADMGESVASWEPF